jgi:hypothetical protein
MISPCDAVIRLEQRFADVSGGLGGEGCVDGYEQLGELAKLPLGRVRLPGVPARCRAVGRAQRGAEFALTHRELASRVGQQVRDASLRFDDGHGPGECGGQGCASQALSFGFGAFTFVIGVLAAMKGVFATANGV